MAGADLSPASSEMHAWGFCAAVFGSWIRLAASKPGAIGAEALLSALRDAGLLGEGATAWASAVSPEHDRRILIRYLRRPFVMRGRGDGRWRDPRS